MPVPQSRPLIKPEVRDPTGAGDAFCGAYTACRLQGIPPTGAARRATVAASMVIECEGAEAALALSPEKARQVLEAWQSGSAAGVGIG